MILETITDKIVSLMSFFWSCAKDLDVGFAVDDHRHSTVVHMAKAISAHDLREKVLEICPPNTTVPSDEWIHLQFSPVCQSYKVKIHWSPSSKG